MKIIIAHAAWLPERRVSLVRLLDALHEPVMVSASLGPEHASVWARRAWEWAAQQDEHVLVLNDDVLPHPHLRAICEAMIEAVPDEALSLHTNIPGAAAVAALSQHHWVRCYWYTGPAVILPPARARSLLAWVYRTPWTWLSRTNEDNAAIQWAWEEQRPFWCAIPAPIGHDVSVRSTLGYDDHALRVPTVPWSAAAWEGAELTSPSWWRSSFPPPHVENFWAPPGKLEAIRRVLAEPGAVFCAMGCEREGVVGARGGPRVCYSCATKLYGAACAAGREART